MKNKIVCGFALLLCLMLMNTTIAINFVDSETGILKGFVKNENNRSISDAVITVKFHGNEIRIGMSNDTGLYVVEDIPTCRCLKNVTCKAKGYRIQMVDLCIYPVTWYNFTLIKILDSRGLEKSSK